MSRPCIAYHAGVKSVERSALVKYTPAQMFALVNDVASYPQFLPWCSGARVQPVADDEILATVEIARSVLRTRFTTRNRLVADSCISMSLEHGPFRHLQAQWRFLPIAAAGSRVSFRVDFEFDNRLMAVALDAAFESICGTLVAAFVERARVVYGG